MGQEARTGPAEREGSTGPVDELTASVSRLLLLRRHLAREHADERVRVAPDGEDGVDARAAQPPRVVVRVRVARRLVDATVAQSARHHGPDALGAVLRGAAVLRVAQLRGELRARSPRRV